jgi:hypothetical protein
VAEMKPTHLRLPCQEWHLWHACFKESYIQRCYPSSSFWLLDSTYGLCGLLKQKGTFFLGKSIVTLSPTAPIKLVSLSMSHPIASRSCILIFLATCCTIPIRLSMVEGPSCDRTIANSLADEETRSDSRMESITAAASSPIPWCHRNGNP